MKHSADFASCALSRQRGFTLIEVLIAALVLSIGLIGMAGLNAVSLKMNQGAYLRTQATNLAYEIADAMRANRKNAGAYKGGTDSDCEKDFARPGGNIAAGDVAEWKNRLACFLPEGTGKIEQNGNFFTITVNWNESRFERKNEDDEEIIQSFSFSTEL